MDKMKNKLSLLLVSITLLTTLGTAISVSPDSSKMLTMSPGGENSTQYDIQLEGNETQATVFAENTGDYEVYFSRTYFPSDGSVRVQVEAPDSAQYKKNLTIVYQAESENNGSTSTNEVRRKITAETIDPYRKLFDGWVNTTQKLVVNGGDYPVSSIQSSLYLKNNSVKIPQGSSKTVNNVRLSVTDTIPGQYAKVVAETQDDSASFTVEQQSDAKSAGECQLFISTQGGTTIRRGQMFIFQTVKQESGEAVGNVYVRLTRVSDGSLIGKTTTDQYGYGEIQIPETLGSDSPDKLAQVKVRVQKQDSNCKPTQKVVSPNTPYGDYIENKEKFHLKLNIDKEKFSNKTSPLTNYGNNVTGSVVTKTGKEIKSGVIMVKKPSGDKVDFAFKDGSFSYSPPSTGTYQIRATKTNYKSSKWFTFKHGDKCPQMKGTVEAKGCLKEEVSLEFFTKGKNGKLTKVPVSQLKPKTTYIVKAFKSDNQLAENFDETVTIEPGDGEGSKEIQFKNGVTRLSLAEPDTYSISYDGGDRFKALRERAELKGGGLSLSTNQIAGIVLLLIGAGVGFYFFVLPRIGNNGGGSGGRQRDVKVDQTDIGSSMSGGGGSQLQNPDIGQGGGQEE